MRCYLRNFPHTCIRSRVFQFIIHSCNSFRRSWQRPREDKKSTGSFSRSIGCKPLAYVKNQRRSSPSGVRRCQTPLSFSYYISLICNITVYYCITDLLNCTYRVKTDNESIKRRHSSVLSTPFIYKFKIHSMLVHQ